MIEFLIGLWVGAAAGFGISAFFVGIDRPEEQEMTRKGDKKDGR